MPFANNLKQSIRRYRYSYNLKVFSWQVKKCIRRKVREIMVKNVVSVDQNMPLLKAANLMRESNISSLVVTEKGIPKGIITEQDFVRKLGTKPEQVKDIYTQELITISPNQTIFEANRLLLDHKFRKLVVVDKGKMVGIITQTDLIRTLGYFGTNTVIEAIDVPLVREVMSSPVKCIEKDKKLEMGRKLMAAHKIGCLVVNDKDLGILTERDLVNEYSKDPSRLDSFLVVNSMTSPVTTVPERTNVFTANLMMIAKGFRRLPVMSEITSQRFKMTGIVTETDICRAMYQFIRDSLSKIEKKEYLHIEVENIKKKSY